MTNDRFGVEKRWTPNLVKAGWMPVPNTFLRQYAKMGLTSAEVILILQVQSYRWTEELPFPSVGLLSDRMGIGQDAVRHHLRGLEKKGLLRRIMRRGKPSLYDFDPLFAKLTLPDEQLIEFARPKPTRKESKHA